MPSESSVVDDLSTYPDIDWGAVAADEFDRVCAMMPEHRSNARIALRLSMMLGYHISREAVGKWRKGQTHVQYRVVCAAREAAGVRVALHFPVEPFNHQT